MRQVFTVVLSACAMVLYAGITTEAPILIPFIIFDFNNAWEGKIDG